MKIENVIQHIASIDRLLDARRVLAAFEALMMIVPSGEQGWKVNAELGRLRQAYNFMSDYALDNRPDAGREAMLDDIAEGLRTLSRQCLRAFRMADDPALYYSTARFEALRAEDSISSLTAEINRLSDIIAMSMLVDDKKPVDPKSGRLARPQLEEAVRRLFNRVWTTHPLSSDDATTLLSVMKSSTLPAHIRHYIVSALLLGELEFHDDRRLTLFMDAYALDDADPNLALTALTALMISLWVHRRRSMRAKTRARFAALTEMPRWQRDIKTVNLELARTRDTERINRKINDELLPKLMKLRPDILRRMGNDESGTIDPLSIEQNPEWAEMLDKSGISDKLKELSEIQEDGGDVMMATFGNLKAFPFFHSPDAWFLPFYSEHSMFENEGDSVRRLALSLEQFPMFCDSDKYSLMCALKMMPSSRRDMFLQQINSQTAGMENAFDGAANPEAEQRRHIIATYTRGLYRFFKLFRRKNEFLDFFTSPVNLASLPMLADTLDDAETIELMAEFYFKRGYYADAMFLFDRLTEKVPATAQLFQKIGYCRQQTGDIEGALENFEQSEMLDSDSQWTLRRIASCHRALGHPEKALDYYSRLERMRPDDLNLSMAYGNCLLEASRSKEALKKYFKVEFMEPENNRTLRPIAWALLMTGDTARARSYYGRILTDNPAAADLLNAGHLEMVSGNYRAAVETYAKAVAAMEFDLNRFMKDYGEDIAELRRLGVDDFMTGLVLDHVMQKVSSRGSRLSE